MELRDKVVPDLPDNSVKEHLSIFNCGHDVGSGRSVMEGKKETSAYTYVEMLDKVEPDLPDNSVKEHLSIVNCGHDVGSGRYVMDGQKETSTYTIVEMCIKVVPDLPDNSVKEHLPIVNCGHDVGSGRSAMEGQKDYPSILRLHQYLLDTWPTITIELVNLIIAMVGNDSRSVASERTISVENSQGTWIDSKWHWSRPDDSCSSGVTN